MCSVEERALTVLSSEAVMSMRPLLEKLTQRTVLVWAVSTVHFASLQFPDRSL